MDFTFTPEQEQFRSTVSRALTRGYSFDDRQAIVASDAGWSEKTWNELVELGLTAVPFAEEVGGMGGSIVDLVAVAEVVGAHLLVEPWISSTVLAGGALAASGHADAGPWLEKIAAGEATAALAHEEGLGTPDPSMITTTAAASGDSYALTGEKKLVLHGAAADIVLVTALLDGAPALFLVDGGAAAATPFTTVDGRRAAHLRFDATPARLLAADAESLIRSSLDTGIVVLAAEAVGAMGELLARTAEYAFTREQFGVPIGSFQTIAHRLADMKIAHAKARATLLYTTALAEAGQLGSRDVSILKGQVGRLGRQLGEWAIQTHGGVGMTDELTIGHLHKRVIAFDAMLGALDYHLRVLGQPASA